jgi:Zn-dependent protease
MDEASGARPTVWALRVGRGLLGVPVSLHWSLFLLPLFIYSGWVNEFPKGMAPYGYLLALACGYWVLLEICIYLHEVGHALAALRTGVPVPEILLTLAAGLTMVGRRARSANHEVVVSLAGPLVTFMLMGIFLAGYLFEFDVWLEDRTGASWTGLLFRWGLYGNAAMGLSNLVPMMPFDGGCTFRALLAFRMDPRRATEIASTVGQVIAFVLAGVGIYMLFRGGGFYAWLLIGFAVWGFVSCYQERILAREGPVYAEGDYGWEDAGESWKAGTTEAPKPGWWARWMERRRQARLQREAQEEQAFRARVDELLAKVKREGMDSLTKAERQMLDEASVRFRKGQSERRRP